MRISIVVTAAVALAGGIAHAETPVTGDGYCDYVQGVAAAESAVLLAPTVFGQFGVVEQAAGAVNPDLRTSGLRLIAGVRYSLDGVYKGLAVRERARAECRRHAALEQVRGETLYQALGARARVLDEGLAEAETVLRQTLADLAARRTTAQEATATRLRVEALRKLATETRRELSLLPEPSGPLAGALAAFQRADHEVERIAGKLRRAAAFDVSVRVGFDQFLDGAVADDNPYFAVLAVGVNLGALWQGKGNARAAAGRARLVQSGRDPSAVDASRDRVQALIETEARRIEEVAALEADLAKQLKALDRLGGEDTRRYRQTVWFEWVEIKAELAYLEAHVAALRQVLGEPEPGTAPELEMTPEEPGAR